MLRDIIPKEPYITPSVISEKLKVNVSFARQAIKELVLENKLAPTTEYHSRWTTFVKTANFVAPAAPEKKDPKQKGDQQKGGEKPEGGKKAEKATPAEKAEKAEKK